MLISLALGRSNPRDAVSLGMLWGWGCGGPGDVVCPVPHPAQCNRAWLCAGCNPATWAALNPACAFCFREPLQVLLFSNLFSNHLPSCISDSVSPTHMRNSVGSGGPDESFAKFVALSYKASTTGCPYGCTLTPGQRLPVCHPTQEPGRSCRSYRMWKQTTSIPVLLQGNQVRELSGHIISFDCITVPDNFLQIFTIRNAKKTHHISSFIMNICLFQLPDTKTFAVWICLGNNVVQIFYIAFFWLIFWSILLVVYSSFIFSDTNSKHEYSNPYKVM